MIFEIVEAVVLLVIIASAIFAIRQKDLLSSVVGLAAMSLMLSVEFYILQAPDVAIAEAAVGAALTTAIFIFAIRGTRRYEE